MRAQRIQKLAILQANTSAAGTYSFDINLDTNYKKCVGIAVITQNLGGLDDFDISLEEVTGKVTIDSVSQNLIGINTPNTSPNDRFFDVDFPVVTDKTTIKITTGASLSADLKVQVAFLLQEPKF